VVGSYVSEVIKVVVRLFWFWNLIGLGGYGVKGLLAHIIHIYDIIDLVYSLSLVRVIDRIPVRQLYVSYNRVSSSQGSLYPENRLYPLSTIW